MLWVLCMCAREYVFVCMRALVCVRACVRARACVGACMCARARARVCVCILVDTSVGNSSVYSRRQREPLECEVDCTCPVFGSFL